jgi:hypothetical protein
MDHQLRRLFAAAVTLAVLAGKSAAQVALDSPVSGISLAPLPRFVGSGLELADVNGDGRLDMVLSDNFGQFSYTHQLSVFLNLGNGAFGPQVVSDIALEGADYRLKPALALGDLNGDGRADLVTTRLATNTPPDGNRPNLAVLFGQEDGRFTGQVNLANSSTDRFMRSNHERMIALGDMDGDTDLDIVSVASSFSYSVLLNNGDGTFALPIQSGGGFAVITQVADIDGDGDLDVAGVANRGSDNRPFIDITVDFNDGGGNLTLVNTITLDTRVNILHTGQARFFLRDLDADGRADITVIGERGSQSGAGGIYVLRSNGDGQFTQVFRETRSQDNLRTASILVDDFDGDGDGDIVKLPNGGLEGEILVNDGSIAFAHVPLLLDTSYYITGASGNILGSSLPEIVYYDDGFDNEALTRLRWAENRTPVGCSADFNSDTFVNPDDLSDFVTCFFVQVQFPDTCPQADFNADQFVNPDDLSDYITAFFLGC